MADARRAGADSRRAPPTGQLGAEDDHGLAHGDPAAGVVPPDPPAPAPRDPALFDLSARAAADLCPELAVPLVGFLEARGRLSPEEASRQRRALLDRTGLHDYAAAAHAAAGDAAAAAAAAARAGPARARLAQLAAAARPMTEFLSHRDLAAKLRKDKAGNAAFLAEEFGINAPQIEALQAYGLALLSAGRYRRASELLEQYGNVATSADRAAEAAWGRLAGSILAAGAGPADGGGPGAAAAAAAEPAAAGAGGDWGPAHGALVALGDLLDANRHGASPLNLHRQRARLLVWGLFVFHSHPAGRGALLDLALSEPYLQAAQTCAPWLLRYVAAATLAHRDRRQALRETLRALRTAAPRPEGAGGAADPAAAAAAAAADPVCAFLLAVHGDHDLAAAHRLLREAGPVLGGDFFLRHWRSGWEAAARSVVFEATCRLRATVDLGGLAAALDLEPAEAERWVAELAGRARVGARVDAKGGRVVMGAPRRPPAEALLDALRQLSVRTYVLADAVLASAEPAVAGGA